MVNPNNFQRISPYLHVYDLKVSSFLQQWNNEIELYKASQLGGNEISSQYYEKTEAANFPNPFIEISNYLNPLLEKLVKNYYEVGDNILQNELNIYRQNNKSGQNVFHNHVLAGGGIAATLYSSIPRFGGELEVFLPPNEPISIKPELDKVYIFPNWLLHRPMRQDSESVRICFNWGYVSRISPIHLLSKDRW